MKLVPHGGKREGAGRKPLYGRTSLVDRLTVKVFPGEHARWKAAAKREGKPLNLWVRERLNASAGSDAR